MSCHVWCTCQPWMSLLFAEMLTANVITCWLGCLSHLVVLPQRQLEIQISRCLVTNIHRLTFSSHHTATNIPSSSRRESQLIHNLSECYKTHIGKMLIWHIRKLQIECICQHFILPSWTVYPFTLPLSLFLSPPSLYFVFQCHIAMCRVV